jgi:hypothetical protein
MKTLFTRSFFLALSILLIGANVVAQTIAATTTQPAQFVSAQGSMRVRNFNQSSLTVFVGKAPGSTGQFNQGTTNNGTAIPFSYRWTASNSTLAVWRGTTQICSYVYDITSGLQSPKGNVLTTSFWVASTGNNTVSVSASDITLNGIAVDASAFTCTSSGGRVFKTVYLQNWARGINLNSDFTFNFTLNIPSSRSNYSGGESTKMEVGLGYINSPKAVLSGTASICNGSSTPLSVAFTGNAPYSLSYSNGSSTTSVSGITSNPYSISVSPTAATTYSITALSDAYGKASSADWSGTPTITVNNAPVVTGFAPAKAGPGGTITITGTGLGSISSVTLGGTASSAFTIIDNSTITATVAFGNSGSISVSGGCGVGSKAGFEYSNITHWLGGNTNWNEAGNWDNGVPNSYYHAVVTALPTEPTLSTNATWQALTVNENASLNIGSNTTLTIATHVVNNGNIKGNGNLLLNGTTAQQLSGKGSISNLTYQNTNGITISSSNSEVIITEKLTPLAGVLTTNNNLILQSNNAGTAIIAPVSYSPYIAGKASVERYVAARRAWRLMGFPITATDAPTINQSIQEGAGGNSTLNPYPGYGTHITGGTVANGFDPNPAGNASVRTWNGSAWQPLSSTLQALTNHNAYMIFVRGSRANNLAQGTGATPDATVLRALGHLKQGRQDILLAQNGWQMVANPFAATVDLMQIAQGNNSLVNANFKVWDNKLGGSNNVGGYVTISSDAAGSIDVVPTPASDINSLLQPGAVFFSDVTQTGTLKIEETYKQNSRPTQLFRGMPVSKLKINLLTAANNTVVDGAMVAYGDNYNSAIDGNDASKLNSTQAENIFVNVQNVRYSIDRRNSAFVTDTIFISFGNVFIKNYVLELEASQFNSSYSDASVIDVFTGTSMAVNLYGKTSVPFTVSQVAASYAPNRFVVVFKKSVVLPVKISSSNATLQQGKMQVSWIVQEQVNIVRYAVQQSTDGINFTTVGEVTATNSASASYQWLARQALTQPVYCRIIAIDANGKFTYSPLMRLQPEAAAPGVKASLQPQNLQVQINRINGGKIFLSLLNTQGQLLAAHQVQHAGGNGYYSFALPANLPSGVYQLRIQSDQGFVQVLQLARQ